jgi:SAM-dependent methyltransferase
VTGDFGQKDWEDHYRSHASHGSRRPSPQLVAEVADLAPGTALEAGCGEGANAAWLARGGWRVTAVDISATALRRAREYAESLAADVASRIDWVEADLTAAPPDGKSFDLVTAHYVHPAGPFDELIRRLADAVAPGGTLLVVGHDPADAHSSAHAPADVSFTAGDVAAGLDPARWEVEVAETREREGARHGIMLRDAVLRARMRP